MAPSAGAVSAPNTSGWSRAECRSDASASKSGSANVSRDIPALIELYQAGTLKLDELISGRYALEDINDAIASVKRGEALRNVVIF